MRTRFSELQELDHEELAGRLKASRRELYELRFKLAVGQQENHSEIHQVRKDIARILTALRSQELGLAPAPAPEPAPAAPAAPSRRRRAAARPKPEAEDQAAAEPTAKAEEQAAAEPTAKAEEEGTQAEGQEPSSEEES